MKSNIPEEETLTPIIKDIEKLTRNAMRSISNFFKQLGLFIQRLFASWKKLVLLGFLGGVLGAASLLIFPRTYESSITLKTYIDAKDQLFNDVKSLNAIIDARKYNQLATILGISKKDAESILSVDISAAASLMERLNSLDKIYTTLDSTLKKSLQIEDILENDKFTLLNKFKVTIYANDPLVYEGMEAGLIEFLERVPELNRLRKNKMEIIKMQKKSYQQEIQSLDSLKKILNQVMLAQAKAKEGSEMTINMGKSGESDLINPLTVYDQVNNYVEKAAELEAQIPNYEKCYTVVSHLNQTGQKSAYGGLARAIIGAIILGFIGVISVLFAPKQKQ